MENIFFVYVYNVVFQAGSIDFESLGVSIWEWGKQFKNCQFKELIIKIWTTSR